MKKQAQAQAQATAPVVALPATARGASALVMGDAQYSIAQHGGTTTLTVKSLPNVRAGSKREERAKYIIALQEAGGVTTVAEFLKTQPVRDLVRYLRTGVLVAECAGAAVTA